MILAYGSAPVTNTDKEDGKPLVAEKDSEGYDADYQNNGGPLKLVIGQKDATDVNNKKQLKDVVSIEVTASEIDSWNHSSSEVFKEYLKDTVKLQVVDENGTSLYDKDFTVEELEAMEALIERDEITSTSTDTCEGINFWKFVKQETKDVPGMDKLITVNVSAKDGFTKDILSIFGEEQLQNGIKDGTRRVPILLTYAMNGYPLASGGKSNPNGPGYDSTVGNNGGPIRLMTHGNQGACLQETNKIVIKVKGEDVKFNTETAGKELPNAGVRAVKFDKDGGMWVGTYGGGAAYKAKGADSYTVYNKSSQPALETTYVSALAPDADGGVWMSQNASYTDPSANKGVVYMKDGKITSYRAADKPQTIPDDYVQDIKIDNNGNVWFASFGGLTKYDPKSGEWKTWDKNDGFPAMSITKMEFDGNGGIWCGFYPDGKGTKDDPFTGGFAHIDKDGKIVSYPQTAEFDEASGQSKLADVWVRDIAIDKDGAAWIVASGANIENVGGTLWYVKGTDGETVKCTGDQLFGKSLNGGDNAEIRMVESDGNGGMYFGTSADGILYVKDAKISSENTLKVTTEYSKGTGAWESDSMNNIYSLDVYGTTIYAGSSGGLAWLKTDSGEKPDDKENVGDADASTCNIAITGAGIKANGYFTIKGLKNANGIQKQTLTYTWQNSGGTTGESVMDGAYVENILKDVVGLKTNATKITFTAEDGYSKTFDVSDMSKEDIHGLKPMLAWGEDGDKINLKLVIGQKEAGESNKGKWVSDIVSITVDASGEETPEEPDKPVDPDDGKDNVGDSDIENCDIAIVGDGIKSNGYFTIKGLKNAQGIVKKTLTYAWQNSSGTTGNTEAEGAYVENILKDVVGLKSNATTITFIASDGYSRTFDVSDMSLEDINGLKPMLAWKEDGEKINCKFIIGQQEAGESNKKKWVGDIVKIVVDAEGEDPDKPVAPTDPTDPNNPGGDDSDNDNQKPAPPADQNGGNGADGNSDKANSDSAKTGDEMPIGLLAVVLAAAAAGTIGTLRFRRKSN